MANLDSFVAHGVTLEYQPSNKHVIDGKTPFAWQCTLKYNGKEHTFTYTKGAAHVGKKIDDKLVTMSYQQLHAAIDKVRYGETLLGFMGYKPIPPSMDEVLFCLQSDVRCYLESPTWKDFCSELGYNEDSRKEYKIYESCRETFQELNRLFFHYFDEFMKIDFPE